MSYTASGDHETYYHITDKPNFELDPHYSPDRNTTSGGDMKPGIFLTKNPESWVNGHGYVRPWLAEIHAPKNLGDHDGVHSGGYQGETYVQSHHFDKLHVNRVIPLDAHAREEYGGAGWIEGHHGSTFDTGEKLHPRDSWRQFKGYHYDGPDARDMDPATVKQHRDRWVDYMVNDRGHDRADFEDHHTASSHARTAANDWDAIRRQHSELHRGFGLELDDDVHNYIHNPRVPVHQRAQKLLEVAVHGERDPWRMAPKEGLGQSWSTDPEVAHHFARTDASERQKHEWSADGEEYGYNRDGTERQRPETRVVLHAHMPGMEGISTEQDCTRGKSYDHDKPTFGGRYEREVPINKGHPVRIKGISWGLSSHFGDDPAPHDRPDAMARHEFDESQIHTANA